MYPETLVKIYAWVEPVEQPQTLGPKNRKGVVMATVVARQPPKPNQL